MALVELGRPVQRHVATRPGRGAAPSAVRRSTAVRLLQRVGRRGVPPDHQVGVGAQRRTRRSVPRTTTSLAASCSNSASTSAARSRRAAPAAGSRPGTPTTSCTGGGVELPDPGARGAARCRRWVGGLLMLRSILPDLATRCRPPPAPSVRRRGCRLRRRPRRPAPAWAGSAAADARRTRSRWPDRYCGRPPPQRVTSAASGGGQRRRRAGRPARARTRSTRSASARCSTACSPYRPIEARRRAPVPSGPRRCAHLVLKKVTALTAYPSVAGTRKPDSSGSSASGGSASVTSADARVVQRAHRLGGARASDAASSRAAGRAGTARITASASTTVGSGIGAERPAATRPVGEPARVPAAPSSTPLPRPPVGDGVDQSAQPTLDRSPKTGAAGRARAARRGSAARTAAASVCSLLGRLAQRRDRDGQRQSRSARPA